jgi:hypothetical protein
MFEIELPFVPTQTVELNDPNYSFITCQVHEPNTEREWRFINYDKGFISSPLTMKFVEINLLTTNSNLIPSQLNKASVFVIKDTLYFIVHKWNNGFMILTIYSYNIAEKINYIAEKSINFDVCFKTCTSHTFTPDVQCAPGGSCLVTIVACTVVDWCIQVIESKKTPKIILLNFDKFELTEINDFKFLQDLHYKFGSSIVLESINKKTICIYDTKTKTSQLFTCDTQKVTLTPVHTYMVAKQGNHIPKLTHYKLLIPDLKKSILFEFKNNQNADIKFNVEIDHRDMTIDDLIIFSAKHGFDEYLIEIDSSSLTKKIDRMQMLYKVIKNAIDNEERFRFGYRIIGDIISIDIVVDFHVFTETFIFNLIKKKIPESELLKAEIDLLKKRLNELTI